MLNGWIIIGAIVWWYALSVLKRAKLDAYFFWVGAIGLIALLAFMSRAYFVWFLSAAITQVTGIFGHLTGMFTVTYIHNLIEIHNAHGLVMLLVDYECSGIIETLAYLSLVVFYPLYNMREKGILIIGGSLWIFVSNVIRLLVISVSVYYLGADSLFWMHSVVGRIVFYILVIILYYNVFTRPQIIRTITQGFNYKEKRNV